MEPVFIINTDVNEEDFKKAVIATYSWKFYFPYVLFFAFCLYSTIDVVMKYGLSVYSFLYSILGIAVVLHAIITPRKAGKRFVYERVCNTGDSTIHAQITFFDNKILFHEIIKGNDHHIPYHYITKIYTFEEMLILTTSGNQAIHIMMKDVPDEETS